MIENTYRANKQIQSEVLPTSEEVIAELKKYGIEPEMPQPKPGELQPAQPSGKPDMQSDVSGLAKGAMKTAENIANVIPDVGNMFLEGSKALDEWMLKSGITKEHLVNPKSKPFERYDWEVKPTKEQEFSFLLGSFASQLATFGLTAAKTGSLFGGAVAGSATSFAAQDPKAPRFSDYLKDTPIVGPVAELLASSPEDTEAEARFKNATEALGIDAALGLAVSKLAGGYRAWKSSVSSLEETSKAIETGFTGIRDVPGSPKTFTPKELNLLFDRMEELGGSLYTNQWDEKANYFVPKPVDPGAPKAFQELQKLANKSYQMLQEAQSTLPNTAKDRLRISILDNEKELHRQAQILAEGDVISLSRRQEFKIIKEPVESAFKGMSPSQVDEEIQASIKNMDTEGGNINLRPYLRSNERMAGAVSVIEQRAGAIGKPSSKTDAETFYRAAEIVGNKEKMTEILNRPIGSMYSDVEIAAINMEMTAAFNEADKLAKEGKALQDAGQQVPENMQVAFDQQLKYFTNMVGKFNSATSPAGSALRMANFSFDAKGQAKAMGQYLDLIGGKETVLERMSMVNDILEKDPQGLMKVGNLVTKENATLGEALLEVRIQNMLSPVTAVKVGVSNMAQHLTETLARSTGARLAEKAGDTVMADIMRQAADAQQKTLYNSLGAELVSGIKTFLEDVHEHGLRALKPSEMTKNNRYAYRTVPAMSGKALGIQNRIGATLVDAYGEASKLGAVPLQLVDIYSDAIARRTEGAYRSIMAGLDKGLTGEELINFVDDVTKERPIKPTPPLNPTPAEARAFAADMEKYMEYSEIWKQIDDYANKVKFQQTPTTGIGGKFYEMVASSDMTIAGVPLLRAASPFIRNKINMAQAAFDVLPGLRGFSVRNQEILKQGGTEAYLLKARWQLANMALGAAAVGGFAGVMYGRGALNPDVARVQKERGFNPYSFMNTANFDVAGTPGIMAAIGTDLGFLARYYMSGAVDDKWNTDFTDATTYIAATLADRLAPEDMIIDMWHSLSSLQENPGKEIQRQLIKEGVTTALPSAATFNAVRKLTDPTRRQNKSDALGIIQNIIMDLANRIPGVNKALEPALDTLGYPITEKFGAVRLVTEFDPEFMEKNKVLKGLVDLGMAGALVTPHPAGPSKDEMVIRPMAKSLKLRGTAEEIPLTPKQYNDLVLLSLGKTDPNKPGDVEKIISDILSSNRSDALKKLQILKVVGSRREAAKAMLVNKYPELKDKWRELVKQRSQAYREEGVATILPGVSVDDSQGPLGADFTEE